MCGFMGKEVRKLCDLGYRTAELFAGVDPMASEQDPTPCYKSFEEIEDTSGIDCIVDFSHRSATSALLAFAERNRLPLVLATTGHTEDEICEIRAAAKNIPIFYSANMSLGVALLVELAKSAAAALPEADIEIIEKHHNRKLDAPSGTALMIANAITEVRESAVPKTGRSGQGKRTPEEIGIHAVRLGNVVGEHEVILATQNQIITLKHEAQSRALFAEGALAAAAFIVDMAPGMYDMKSLVVSEPRDVTIV